MTRHSRQTTSDRPTTDQTKKNDQKMKDVSHAHPHADRAATDDLFARGPRVMTDGGRDRPRQTMADVDHTPPSGAPAANRVFERGNEGRDDEERDAP